MGIRLSTKYQDSQPVISWIVVEGATITIRKKGGVYSNLRKRRILLEGWLEDGVSVPARLNFPRQHLWSTCQGSFHASFYLVSLDDSVKSDIRSNNR